MQQLPKMIRGGIGIAIVAAIGIAAVINFQRQTKEYGTGFNECMQDGDAGGSGDSAFY